MGVDDSKVSINKAKSDELLSDTYSKKNVPDSNQKKSATNLDRNSGRNKNSCMATAISTGQRCKNPAIRGYIYCETHKRFMYTVPFLILEFLLATMMYLFYISLKDVVIPALLSPIMQYMIYVVLILVIVIVYVAVSTLFTNILQQPKYLVYILVPIVFFALNYLLSYINNINKDFWLNIPTYWWTWIIGIIVVLVLIIATMIVNRNNIQLNFKAIAYFIIILLILNIGVYVAYSMSFTEEDNLDMSLNLCQNTSIKAGLILKCERPIYVDKIISCNIENLNMPNFNGTWRFTYDNGALNETSFENNIYFLAPSNLRNVGFVIMDTTPNITTCYSSGLNKKFPTYEQYRENRKQFGIFFFAIVIFLLVSFPIIIKNYNEFMKK